MTQRWRPAGGRWLVPAAVVALLGAAMLAATFRTPSFNEFGGSGRPPGPISIPNDYASQSPNPVAAPQVAGSLELPEWLGWLLMSLCLGIVLAVVAMVAFTFLRERLPTQRAAEVMQGEESTLTETKRRLRDAVEGGLSDLDDDGDPRRAVIKCWVRLEEAAAKAGTGREPGDTSTDLVSHLLRTHDVDGELLGRFAALYRWARFAPHTVDPAMRDQARDALSRLRDDLSRAGRLATRPPADWAHGQPAPGGSA